MENFTVEVAPEKVNFFGLQVSQTIVSLWIATAIILVFCLVLKFFLIKKFKDRPGVFQNIIELCVEAVQKMTRGNLGSRGGGMMAYSFTIIVTLVVSSLLELFGMRGPATDFNFALSIAVMSFVIIVAYGIKYKGPIGYLKSFGEPKGFMWPFRVLSQLVLPISLSCRLFGNLFAALVVMDIVYAAMASFAVGVPAVLSIYFNLFDVGIQTYIFITLTQIFVNEAVEETEGEREKKLKRLRKKEEREKKRQLKAGKA